MIAYSGILRALALVSFGLGIWPAQAAELIYRCEGLWSTPLAILKATATVEGTFEPKGCTFTARVALETGGVLSGKFTGADPFFSNGTLALDGGSLTYAGSLTKVSTVDGHGGFRFDSNNALALFSCQVK